MSAKLITRTSRKLKQEDFLAITLRVKAELGPRPPMPRTGPLSFQGYRSVSDAEFDRRMATYNEQDDACRAWDRAFKAMFKEIEATWTAPVAPSVEDLAA